ncbi:MAG: DUF4197 domain-containing protein [Nitrospirae bacterium]|nr:MAG: DUF4197 domain-containing protein [Nitrospirota bacterium]
MHLFLTTVLTIFVCLPTPSLAQFGDLFEGLKQFGMPSESGLREEKIVSGLKEALLVGTEHAVQLTGTVDGYLKNEAIKILLPERLQAMDQALRMVGFGPQVDEFVTSMNRAAERAVPLAKPIFEDAIRQMSFEDAKAIWQGGETAATEYFQAKTRDRLAQAFKPVVEQTMSEVGVAARYKQLMAQYTALPFVNAESFDLDQYVVGKTLDGLFYVLAQEERKIRTDPTARVTDLLQEVFGRR